MRHFHHFAVGDRQRLGPIPVTRAEALDFARRYDPQPFHLSEEGAQGHPFFERMAASGWLVCALAMRLLVEDMKANPVASVGTPGVDSIRWLKPVYPGDLLTLETEVTATRPLASRPGLGLVRQRQRVWNQHRQAVMTAASWQFVAVQ